MALASLPRTDFPSRPYLGIEPFRYVDRAIFFAREREIQKLFRYVTMYRAVLLYGESGCGKSSLINAGFIPLARAEQLTTERIRVQPRPQEEIVIERIATSEAEGAPYLPSVFTSEGRGPQRLVLSAEEFHVRVAATAHEHRPILVFDQFEELVTLFEQRSAGWSLAEIKEVQQRILEVILKLIQEPLLPVKLLFVFREDYLAKLGRLFTAYPDLRDQYLRLAAPEFSNLRAIIRGPFETAEGRFGPELSLELATRIEQDIRNNAEQDTLNLSAVQTVCLKLWEDPDPETLFAEKGVNGLLGDYVADTITDIPEQGRDLAVMLLGCMVTDSGTRNVISQEDLVRRAQDELDVSEQAISDALHALETKAKLLRSERRHDIYVYEIVSEFLVPGIVRQKEQLQVRRQRAEFERQLEASRQIEARHRRQMWVKFAKLAIGVLCFTCVIGALAGVALFQKHQAIEYAQAAIVNEAFAQQQRIIAEDNASEASRQKVEAQHQKEIADANAAFAQTQALLSRVRQLTSETVRLQDSQFARSVWAGALAVAEASQLTESSDDASLNRDIRVARTAAEEALATVLAARASVMAFLPGHRDRVNSVVFSPDGSRFATAGRDGLVFLRDPITGVPLGEPLLVSAADGTPVPVQQLAFSPDSSLLAAAGKDGRIILWDIPSGQLRFILSRDTILEVDGLAFSSDGQLLASVGGGADSRVQLWNVSDGDWLGAIQTSVEGDGVESIAFRPGSHVIVTGMVNGDIQLWDVSILSQPHLLSPLCPATNRTCRHQQLVTAIVFDQSGTMLASTSTDQSVILWRISPSNALEQVGERMTAHSDWVWGLAFNQAGTKLATAGLDGRVVLWDIKRDQRSGQPTGLAQNGRPFIGHSGGVWSVGFNSDGSVLASGGTEGEVILWDTRQTPLNGHVRAVRAVAFSPSGSLLASAGDDGSIRLWDPKQRQQLGLLPASDECTSADIPCGPSISSLAFTPDGKYVAAGDLSGQVVLWDISNPLQPRRADRVVKVPPPINPRVYSVAISPNGDRLAAGLPEPSIALWTIHNGVLDDQVILPYLDYDAVQVVSFDQTGNLLAAAHVDGKISLWDVPNHRILGEPFSAQSERIWSLALSPTDGVLASADRDGSITLWDIGTPAAPKVISILPDGRGQRTTGLAFSQDGRRLASTSMDGSVSLWDVATTRRVGEPMLGHDGAAWAVAFDGEGSLIASGGDDHSIVLLDLSSGTVDRACTIVKGWLLQRDDIRGVYGASTQAPCGLTVP